MDGEESDGYSDKEKSIEDGGYDMEIENVRIELDHIGKPLHCECCSNYNETDHWCMKHLREVPSGDSTCVVVLSKQNVYESNENIWKDWQEIPPTENLNKSFEDPVNHPSHYTDGKIEVIDFIEDKKLGFHLGNAVKYISRAGKKNPEKEIEDLEKAIWYIKRYIQEYKEARTPISK